MIKRRVSFMLVFAMLFGFFTPFSNMKSVSAAGPENIERSFSVEVGSDTYKTNGVLDNVINVDTSQLPLNSDGKVAVTVNFHVTNKGTTAGNVDKNAWIGLDTSIGLAPVRHYVSPEDDAKGFKSYNKVAYPFLHSKGNAKNQLQAGDTVTLKMDFLVDPNVNSQIIVKQYLTNPNPEKVTVNFTNVKKDVEANPSKYLAPTMTLEAGLSLLSTSMQAPNRQDRVDIKGLLEANGEVKSKFRYEIQNTSSYLAPVKTQLVFSDNVRLENLSNNGLNASIDQNIVTIDGQLNGGKVGLVELDLLVDGKQGSLVEVKHVFAGAASQDQSLKADLYNSDFEAYKAKVLANPKAYLEDEISVILYYPDGTKGREINVSKGQKFEDLIDIDQYRNADGKVNLDLVYKFRNTSDLTLNNINFITEFNSSKSVTDFTLVNNSGLDVKFRQLGQNDSGYLKETDLKAFANYDPSQLSLMHTTGSIAPKSEFVVKLNHEITPGKKLFWREYPSSPRQFNTGVNSLVTYPIFNRDKIADVPLVLVLETENPGVFKVATDLKDIDVRLSPEEIKFSNNAYTNWKDTVSENVLYYGGSYVIDSMKIFNMIKSFGYSVNIIGGQGGIDLGFMSNMEGPDVFENGDIQRYYYYTTIGGAILLDYNNLGSGITGDQEFIHLEVQKIFESKPVSIYQGQAWTPEDSLVFFNPNHPGVTDYTVTDNVDTNTPGVYNVTFTYKIKDDVVITKTDVVNVLPIPGASVMPKVQGIVEGQDIDTVEVTTEDKNAKVSVKGDLSKGLVFENNILSGSPQIDDWAVDEEQREIKLTLLVKNSVAPSSEVTVYILVQRDTDGDGTPDVDDLDDDGDGFTDEAEKAAGTNPKDAKEVPLTGLQAIAGVKVEPKEQTVVEGKEIKAVIVSPEDEQAKVTVEGPLFKGLRFENNVLTGSPQVDDWSVDEEERRLEVTFLVENSDGSKVRQTVTILVQREKVENTDTPKDPIVNDKEDQPSQSEQDLNKDNKTDQDANKDNKKDMKSPNTGDSHSLVLSLAFITVTLVALYYVTKRKKELDK